MARLPVPGSDDGAWGDILNTYLLQTLNTDGTLKTNVVGADNLASNAVTNVKISDGTIAEAKLASAVQSKLNASSTPDWSAITNKPAVIAAGADQAAARTVIGAGTSNLALGTSSTTAKAGDYQPTAANISDSTAVGRNVLKASDQAAARLVIGASTSKTYFIDDYGADPTGATASDTAVSAAISAMGSNPGVLEFGKGTYRLNSGKTLGAYQGLRGQGRGVTKIKFYGTGNCFFLHDPSGLGPPDYGPHLAGIIEGITIDGWDAGTNAVGLKIGDLYGARLENVYIVGFNNGVNAIGLWAISAVSHGERSNWDVMIDQCSNGVVFDGATGTGSYDYCTFNFWIVCVNGQNGVILRNAAQMYGVEFTMIGNFAAGTGNTGTAFTITGNSVMTGHINIMGESSGTGTAHKSIVVDSGSSLKGSGTLALYDFGPGWAASTARYQTAFTGYIDIPNSDLGTSAQWQGQRSIGQAGMSYGVFTGDVLYLGTGNVFWPAFTSGSHTITIDNTARLALVGQAATYDIFLTQPSSGAAATFAWPNTYPGNIQWLSGLAPITSTANNAIDHIRLVTFDHTSFFGMHMNGSVMIPASVSTHFRAQGLNPYNAAISNAPSGGINQEYISPIQVPYACTLNGVGWYNGGTVSGNFKVTLRDSSGVLLASSTATAQSGTYTGQTAAFTSTQTLAPGKYYIGLIASSSTANLIMETVLGGGVFSAASLTPSGSISPPAISNFASNLPALVTY